MARLATVSSIHVIPNFHYDVAYLRAYDEYLPICFRNMDEALRILDENAEYRFLVEQVILVEEYWKRCPEKREVLRRHAGAGRLAVSPGMFVMPDMNHTSGEAMFLQAKIGKKWLRENLGIEPDVCWVADCWGHHAQLPQILTQCGYSYYAFWRCMRPEVRRNDFLWKGLDGTRIKTHWLARGYGNLYFPSSEAIANAPDLDLVGCGVEQVAALCREIGRFGPSETIMLCNGGDFMFPQASGPEVIRRLNRTKRLPPVRFSTPSEFMRSVRWRQKPVVDGDFNSALQGTFASNIIIKQYNRVLTNRLLSLEALAVVRDRPREYEDIWRLVLKQQFHDIVCGTLCDAALDESLREFGVAQTSIEEEGKRLASERGIEAVFNPLSFARTEVVSRGGRRWKVSLPPLGFATFEGAEPPGAGLPPGLPCAFENEFFRATVGEDGYIASLVEKETGAELVRRGKVPFGCLAMQMDYGDLWVNFASPLNGGSVQSALTQNHPDPFDRYKHGALVNTGTFVGTISRAQVIAFSAEGLTVEQDGQLEFWRVRIPFRTRIEFRKSSPLIRYETVIEPFGKHYRIRAAFPTAIEGGTIRHEIPFGIQARGEHEHVAQNWLDYSDASKGLALINRGTPGSNVAGGTMMLTLFRAAAMEYKAPSERSFHQGRPHTFAYAIMPHGAESDVELVRQGLAFNVPPLVCRVDVAGLGPSGFAVVPDNVFISALRWSGTDIFLRVYEAVGRPAAGRISVPPSVAQYARADGLERPVEDFRPCRGKIPLELGRYKIQGFLLRRADAQDVAGHRTTTAQRRTT